MEEELRDAHQTARQFWESFGQAYGKYLGTSWPFKESYWGRICMVLASSPCSIFGEEYPREGVKVEGCQSIFFFFVGALSNTPAWPLKTVRYSIIILKYHSEIFTHSPLSFMASYIYCWVTKTPNIGGLNIIHFILAYDLVSQEFWKYPRTFSR